MVKILDQTSSSNLITKCHINLLQTIFTITLVLDLHHRNNTIQALTATLIQT